jgi:hypothetical protein
VSIAENNDAVNAGVATQSSVISLVVGWFLYRHKRLTVKGVVENFVK